MNTDLLSLFDADEASVQAALRETLKGADDGELFLEHAQAESLSFDNGRLKGGSFNTDQGFGLRAVAGEAVGYAHSGEMTLSALKRAADAAGAVTRGYSGDYADAPQGTNRRLYTEENPIGVPTFEQKVALLTEIDAYLRGKDAKVRQVTASIAASWQVVNILRADGHRVTDVRPMTRINVSVVVGQGDRQETGSYGIGGRTTFDAFLTEESWRSGADEALRQALVNLDAVEAPAGEMTVVLGPGWPGVLLHEAVGHGLEGDFNRKGSSTFSGRIGQRVAAKGVTVLDDGTIPDRRGSLNIDDEGAPSQRNVLIEDGILRGYIQDAMNARLMGVAPTGNGRRESYAHLPMPRMTNTYMLGGDKDPQEIIASIKKGLYASNFGGGQVDITSGKFVFSASEAFWVENGKIQYPVKGATLIGNGPDALTRVSMIGNDMRLDTGVGVCGKEGQSVPVGVGQPTLRIDGLTVGGTKT
ncbi:UNVERIFIED_ORG: metalloprotease TldD [Roseateles sp. XES5]|nr:metalloprotease TldD [Roseateles sp. XES5]